MDFDNPTNCGLQETPHLVDFPAMSTTPPMYVEIGERLALIRTKFSDMTQKLWSETHGFSVTQYNNWEKGVRRISVDEALRLCSRYGLTLDFIYLGRLDGLSDNARNVLSSQSPMIATTSSNG